jgi:hypothetical protein
MLDEKTVKRLRFMTSADSDLGIQEKTALVDLLQHAVEQNDRLRLTAIAINIGRQAVERYGAAHTTLLGACMAAYAYIDAEAFDRKKLALWISVTGTQEVSKEVILTTLQGALEQADLVLEPYLMPDAPEGEPAGEEPQEAAPSAE